MRIFGEDGKIYCQIQASMNLLMPEEKHTHFSPIISADGCSTPFAEANYYRTKENFLVCVFTLQRDEKTTFTNEFLANAKRFYAHSRQVHCHPVNNGKEIHYYIGFTGLQKTHTAIEYFLHDIDQIKTCNAPAIATLQLFQQALQAKMKMRLQGKQLLLTEHCKPTGEVLEEHKGNHTIARFPTVQLSGSSATYIYKEIKSPLSTRPVEIETFSSLLFRYISGNRAPLVLPVYTPTHARAGVLSSKIQDFENIADFLQKCESQGQEYYIHAVSTFVTEYHEDITASAVGRYANGDGDWHFKQWGFEGVQNGHRRRLFNIDTEQMQPISSKYFGFHHDEIRHSGEHCRPSPSQSFNITKRDKKQFPNLPDTHFFHWIDSRWFKGLDLINISRSLGLTFESQHFYFLMMMLLPHDYIERLGDKIFTSENAKEKLVKQICDRYQAIAAQCLKDKKFLSYLYQNDDLLPKANLFIAQYNQGIKDTYFDDCQIHDELSQRMQAHLKHLKAGVTFSALLPKINAFMPRHLKTSLADLPPYPPVTIDDYANTLSKGCQLLRGWSEYIVVSPSQHWLALHQLLTLAMKILC